MNLWGSTTSPSTNSERLVMIPPGLASKLNPSWHTWPHITNSGWERNTNRISKSFHIFFPSYAWECRLSLSSGAPFVKEFSQSSLEFSVWLEILQQFSSLPGILKNRYFISTFWTCMANHHECNFVEKLIEEVIYWCLAGQLSVRHSISSLFV